MRNSAYMLLAVSLAACASTTNDTKQQDLLYLQLMSNRQVVAEFEGGNAKQCAGARDTLSAKLGPLYEAMRSQAQPPTWKIQCVSLSLGRKELPYRGVFENKETGEVSNAWFGRESACLLFRKLLDEELQSYSVSCERNENFGKLNCQTDADCEENFSCRSTKGGGSECRRIGYQVRTQPSN